MDDPVLQRIEQSHTFDLTDYEIKDFWLINNKLDHRRSKKRI